MAHFESPTYRTKVTQAAAETDDTSPRLRFNSLTLDELSEELDRRTKETQRLQEEVEDATKLTLERFGCTYGVHSSPGQSCRFNVYDSPENLVLSTQPQTATQPLISDLDHLNQGGDQRNISSTGKEVLENLIDDCLRQLSDLKLNKAHDDRPQQETFSVDKAIVNLQTQLHEVQMEKDVLSDLRLKDSRIHVGQMEKMLCMLEELQNIKKATDQKVQETEEEVFALNRKVDSLEQNVKEMYTSLLSQEKKCGHNNMQRPNVATNSRQPSQAAKLTEDFNNETEKLQERIILTIEHSGSEECNGVNTQKERMEDLIASLGQEMALLTNKLSSSKNNSDSLSVKLELLKQLAAKQTSMHQCQVSCLEQQLFHTRSQLLDAQRERERSVQWAEELQSQLGQLQGCGKQQQQCEVQEEVQALSGRLEAAREQLRIGGEERTGLKALLEQSTQEGRKSLELLEEKNKELQLRQQESQQLFSRLEEAQSQCQTLLAEGQTLRLQLDDRDKMIAILRSQMESSIQTTLQHSRTIDTFHQENSLLCNQLNQHKLEIQQLRTQSEQQKSELAAAELERQKLQASMTEQQQHVHEETLEREKQFRTQLEHGRIRLRTITKEHKQLQQHHSCKSEEHKGVVLRLQSQLRNACDELDKVRSNLRTLEGAEGHGLKVAMDMQGKITARREQIDTLQGKIHHLEETVEKLHQEKHYQSLEHQRQLKELDFFREEKKHLGNELEALHSKDKQSRERISQLEAILHKMSESFADCQDFIQLKEQEFFRLKLKHALVFKELKGQHVRIALNASPPELDSPSPSAPTAPPQHASNTQITQESPACELRSLVKELRGVVSEIPRPHTDNGAAGSGFHRRRSAPERAHRITFSTDHAKEVKAGSRLRRKTCGSEPHSLKTAELTNGNIINNISFRQGPFTSSPVTAVRYTSTQQLLSHGRRSPVHSLLTSDPNSQQ